MAPQGSAGNVLTRPADAAPVHPLIRQQSHLLEPQTTDTAETATTDTATDGTETDGSDAATAIAGTDDAGAHDTDAHDTDADDTQPDDTRLADAKAGAAVAAPAEDQGHRRRHGWVWAALVVFWLLALGAGVIALASLGAPHYLCTGSASTGLACETTGTVLAAVLTVVLIVAVGTVSVLVIEQRAQGRTAWRWLGIGVVALVVFASCGYLLIRTIGG